MADLQQPEGKVELTPDLSKMSEQQRLQYEHMKLHEKHRGHESMHAEMMLILLVALIVCQTILLVWKAKWPRSYQSSTLASMWLIPFIMSCWFHWWKFIFVWALYSVVTGNVCYMALKKPIGMSTPRWVYQWFLMVYRICYGLGIFGYFCVLLTFLGFNILLGVRPDTAFNFGIIFLFYGLYYGLISRDFSETCTDQMASNIGYYTPSGLPGRQLEEGVCAICGNNIHYADGAGEKRYALTCGHTFHEFCIRGWYIIGKKQTCPYCKEKVDLKRLFSNNPWEITHMYYSNYLDLMRFLVAWLPIIFSFVQGINYILGLE